MIWSILYVIAIVLLILHWGSRNAVWGTATIGAAIGLVVALFRGNDWWAIASVAAVATMIGVVVEWVPRLANRGGRSHPSVSQQATRKEEQIPIPKTDHEGIREHFLRVAMFLDAGARQTHPTVHFRLHMAAIYSCRAIVELMLEEADKDMLVVGRDALEDVLSAKLPYFTLVERIRIHDFHRRGLLPHNPQLKTMRFHGPIKVQACKGAATVQQFAGGPVLVTTGNSTIKQQRPLFEVDGTFYDEKSERQVPLNEIVRDYLFAVPGAVEEFEKLRRMPPTPPGSEVA